MKIEYKSQPPFYKNGYLIYSEDDNKAIIIDPGDEASLLLNIIHKKQLTIEYILLTHAHIDHISGVRVIKNETGATIMLHPEDEFLYQGLEKQANWFGYPVAPAPKIDNYLYDGQIIKISNKEIKVIHTPGHTPGGVCFLIENNLFCGDTLFEGSIGRTDLEGGDYEKLITSIRNKLLILPDDTIVYPGHGSSTTIAREKLFNPFLE